MLLLPLVWLIGLLLPQYPQYPGAVMGLGWWLPVEAQVLELGMSRVGWYVLV